MNRNRRFRQGGDPLFSFESAPLRSRDIGVLHHYGQGRAFSPEVLKGVAVYCAHGFPQVLHCWPFRKGRPFPTTFWLVCPWISHQCAFLESSGGVVLLEKFLEEQKLSHPWKLWHICHVLLRLHLMTASQITFLRRYRPGLWRALTSKGIGGSQLQWPPKVKCLHLQMASYLALGWHPGRGWMDAHFPELSCSFPSGLCARKIEDFPGGA